MVSEAVEIDAQATEQRDALARRLVSALVQMLDVGTIYLGHRLGLYRALAGSGPTTAGGLATRAGIHERYAREWLEQQAATAILTVDDVGAAPGDRRYSLPGAYEDVLVNEDSLYFVPGFLQLGVSAFRPLERLLEAYQTGGGVDWAEYGEDALKGQGAANRPLLLNLLAQEWLPAIPDVHAKLQAGGRAADVGCGAGWAALGLARAYPNARIDGYDIDAASIEEARRNAAAAGVADRVTFHLVDAAAAPAEGATHDLVLACEMVHDLSRPVEILAEMRRLVARDGAVIVVDERTEERFTAPASETERMFYGWSTLICLPSALVDTPSAATGTVMRPDTLRSYARQAGYRDLDVLPIENDFFRVYRLVT